MPSLSHAPFLRLALSVPAALAILASQVAAQEGPARASDRKPGPAAGAAPMGSVAEITRYIEQIRADARAREMDAPRKPAGRETRVAAAAKAVKPRDSRAKSGETEKEVGGWLDAYKFYIKQRAYPGDKVNWAAIKSGVVRRNTMPAAQLRPVSSTPNNGMGGGGGRGLSVQSLALPGSQKWEFIGPKNMKLPLRFYGPNPASGRVNGIAYSPNGAIFVASSSGGVLRSVNGGISWTNMSETWPTLSVSSVAVDPVNGNKVYAGTGDFQGYYVNPFGLMRSVDGGATWINSGQGQFSNTCISHIVVDPESPNIVTLSAGLGIDFFGYVWRSTDSGATWTKAFDSANVWSGLTISAPDKQGNRAYYAAGLGEIRRSLDRGKTWTSLALPSGGSLGAFPDMAASRIDPLTVYLLSPSDQKAFKSADAGVTWTDISSNLTASGDWSQYFYDYHITTSSYVDRFGNTRDMLYVGLIDLHQSIDGGQSWRSAGGVYTGGAMLHPDQHCMAVNPKNPNDALVGCDGGIYRLIYNGKRDSLNIMPDLNQSLGITEFYHGSFHSSDPAKMIGGAQDNSSPTSFGDLGNWDNVAGGDGGFCEIHPLSTNIQYASSQFGTVYQTLNGWKSYTNLFGPFGLTYFIAPITIDPQDPDVLYQGTETVWKYSIKARQWRQLTPQLSAFDAISYIGVSPTDSAVLYAGSGVGELFMTTDGGKTWKEIDQGNPSLPTRFVTSIAVNPDDSGRIVVTLSGTGAGHVWRCDNTKSPNRTWVNASSGLPDIPANTVALDTTDPANTYYVGTDAGVFLTQNGGSSWSNMTAPLGLPNVQVNELRVTYGTGYLNAATYGRGMWRIRVANPIAPVTRLTTIPSQPHGGNPVTLVSTLIGPAPIGGQRVTLQSSDPAIIKTPSDVVVVAGFNVNQLKVNTGAVTSKKVVTITATAGGKTRSLKVNVLP